MEITVLQRVNYVIDNFGKTKKLFRKRNRYE